MDTSQRIAENWRFTKSRGMVGSFCEKCQKHFYPYKQICSICHSSDRTRSYRFNPPFDLLEHCLSMDESSLPTIDSNLPLCFGLIDLGHECSVISVLEKDDSLSRGDKMEPFFIRIPCDSSDEPLIYTISFRKI